MLHLPILRNGSPYRSLQTQTVGHFSTGEPVAEVSLANPGLITRDLLQVRQNRERLLELPVGRLLECFKKAARLFSESELPVGDETQTPQEYIHQLSATTGMPHALCRLNSEKVRSVLENMDGILGGLTRGLDLRVLDLGLVEQSGRLIGYRPETDSLGAILPSNSPGVHSLWLPAIALKIPVILKPGSQEPWTPLRLAGALLQAGIPAQAIGFYPTDYAGAGAILTGAGRSLLFGDESTVGPWRQDTRIQIHGPGWSKVILGPDQAEDWEEHLDLIEESITANGGRSCINASAVWTVARGKELASALARRLARIEALPMEHPKAQLAAFPNAELARRLSRLIDSQLEEGKAEDLTRSYRKTDRVVEQDGAVFLLPTLIWCSDPQHPLARAEYLFPFASVVQVEEGEIPAQLGPTLVATALTRDQSMTRRLLDSAHIERLNLGPMPTNVVAWDQPHEGNLFEFLYRQRALQRVPA